MSNDPQFRRDWKFIAGTTLSVLGAFVVGAIHVGVLFLFGIPLLLIVVGIAFVLISRVKWKTKAIVVIITIAIIPVTFATSIYLNSSEPEIFLIPNGYRGEIVVFLDEQCGSDPAYENGRRIYLIGSDGILITNSGKTAVTWIESFTTSTSPAVVPNYRHFKGKTFRLRERNGKCGDIPVR